MLDAPEWLAVTAQEATSDPWVALVDIIIHIPRVLERSDKLSREGASADAFTTIITDSELIVARGREWLNMYENDRPRYTKVDVRTINGFLDTICDDLTFETVFNFDSWTASMVYLAYWMSMLILQSNAFLLVRKYRTLQPKELLLWNHELAGYADCICRGVPFSCRPEAGYTGRITTLTPLVVARKYFDAKGAKDEIAWCEKAYYGTKVPGLYTPPVPIQPSKGFREFVQRSENYV